MSNLNRKLISKMPLSRALIPFDGARVLKDRYLVVEDECILFYNKFSPQCNSIESLAKSIQEKLYPGAEVRYIPAVYVEDQP